ARAPARAFDAWPVARGYRAAPDRVIVVFGSRAGVIQSPPMTRPLSELRGPVRALFSDVDGTMTTGDRIEAATYAALERLGEAGVPVIMVTGRPAGFGHAFM